MRSTRGALLALGLVGAWYAWRNRDQLGQQLDALKQQASQLVSEAQYQIEAYAGGQESPNGSTKQPGERALGETQM